MLNLIERFWRDERGQTMTEYILITVLVAIALIGAWKIFGKKLFEMIKNSAQKLQEVDPNKAGGGNYPFK